MKNNIVNEIKEAFKSEQIVSVVYGKDIYGNEVVREGYIAGMNDKSYVIIDDDYGTEYELSIKDTTSLDYIG